MKVNFLHHLFACCDCVKIVFEKEECRECPAFLPKDCKTITRALSIEVVRNVQRSLGINVGKVVLTWSVPARYFFLFAHSVPPSQSLSVTFLRDWTSSKCEELSPVDVWC